MAGMKPSALRAAANRLHELLCSGHTDKTARTELGVGPGRYDTIKAEMYAIQRERLRTQTAEEIFTDYAHEQLACIATLKRALEGFSPKHANGIVGCVRTISEIHSKLISTAQSLGVAPLQPRQQVVTGRVDISHLSDGDLRRAIVAEIAALDELVAAYGSEERSILDASLDPGELHRPLPSPRPSKRARAKSSYVHRGRRVVKPTA